jgi:hypothetical protein
MCLLAAATKKVSSEVWALVHEECLDISISGIKPVCVAKYYVVLIPVLFVFLTFCACVGDILGENGISMLAITGYWIDDQWVFKEVLLQCVAFTKERHTGEQIKKKTLEILVSKNMFGLFVWALKVMCYVVQSSHGLGDSEEEIKSHVHGCTPDEGANMLKAWQIFEGAGCVCHRAQNALKTAIDADSRGKALFAKVRGIVAHFHRSIKVTCLCIIAIY